MGVLTNAILREFDLVPSQISEAEKKAVLNVIIIPLALLALTSNILASATWIVLLCLLYITKASHKKQNAEAFFMLLSYVSAIAIAAALAIMILSL